MIKNMQLKVSFDPKGNISSGHKNQDGLPESLDYFNISKFPELIEGYGEKPTALVLFFPTNRITDFLDCNNRLWGRTNTMIRSCDGERCFHRIAEELEGLKCKAGEDTECWCKKLNLPSNHKKRCHYNGWFKAYVLLPNLRKVDNPMPYRFITGSHNSIENVMSALESMLVLTKGNLIGVPFVLTVKMVAGVDKAKFPIWNLFPIGTLSGIEERGRMLELTSKDSALIPESRQLEAGKAAQDLSIFTSQERLDSLIAEGKKAKSRKDLAAVFEKGKAMKELIELLPLHFETLRNTFNNLAGGLK